MLLNIVSQLHLLSGEQLLFTVVLQVLTALLTLGLSAGLMDKEAPEHIVIARLGLHTAQHRVHQGADLVFDLLTDEPPLDGVAGSLLCPAPGFLLHSAGGGGGHQQDEDEGRHRQAVSPWRLYPWEYKAGPARPVVSVLRLN